MRPLLPPSLLAFVLATSAVSTTTFAAPTPAEAPQRMPGLWLMNAAPAGQNANAVSFHVCVGKTDGDALQHPGSPLANCREQAWSKDDFYRYYRATCDAKGGTATVEGKFAGDFAYNFQGQLITRFSPPLDGVATARTDLDGRRLGPCRGGLPEGKFLIKGQDGVGNLNVGDPGKRAAP